MGFVCSINYNYQLYCMHMHTLHSCYYYISVMFRLYNIDVINMCLRPYLALSLFLAAKVVIGPSFWEQKLVNCYQLPLHHLAVTPYLSITHSFLLCLA